MIDFTVETQIARPVRDVFAYATDPGKLPSWQSNTVSAAREDDGPYGGTRLRFRAHGTLSGPTRIIEPLVARMLRKQFAQHVATLKQVLEGAAVTA